MLVSHQDVTAPFTRAGAYRGARAALLLAPTIVIFGATFGMLAATSGLTIVEAAAMSAVVCAGTAQFAALQLWTEPMSWIAAGVTSLVMNSRYLLLGATMRGWFAGLPSIKAYLSLFFMYDGNWVTAVRDRAKGYTDGAHLIGGGIVMCTIWTMATIVGHYFGRLVADPRVLGLDFVITAFFATMAIALWRGRGDLAPVSAAVLTALVIDQLVSGPWYIIGGALAGALVAGMRYRPEIAAVPDAS